MISYTDALKTVLSSAGATGTENVSIDNCLNRILAQEIVTDIDVPQSNLSAMDGYACRQSSLALPLTVVETIPAGYAPVKGVGEGQCSKIMTGAVVPEGADCVVMVEHTEEKDRCVRVTERKSKARNIRLKAEDLHAGEVVLHAGTLITPPVIATLATVGCSVVPVARKPVVTVIATGDELVPVTQKPLPAQIRDSNSHQLKAQIEDAGCDARSSGIARDTPETIDRAFRKAFSESDVVLFSGGVSAGDFDFVPSVLSKNGVQPLFEHIAMKPGKPTIFGRKEDKYFFGLPGNPVSTFVIFELLVRPFLMKLCGCAYNPKKINLPLNSRISRKKADRLEFIPIRLTDEGFVERIEYHGSAHIHAYTQADGIIAIQVGTESIDPGTAVEVLLL